MLVPMMLLTHWFRVTHTCICVSDLSIPGSDNGLSPGRRQAIIWTNARILSVGSLGTNFNEIWIKINIFSLTKMHLQISSAKWRPFCPGRDELILRVLEINLSIAWLWILMSEWSIISLELFVADIPCCVITWSLGYWQTMIEIYAGT